MLYPWQIEDYQSLIESFNRGNFNCLLIYGAVNSGRELLRELVIKYMLCLNPENSEPCNKCSACILIAEGNHPDLYILAPEENDERKNSNIKVEQVRDMIDFALKSQHVSARKVVLLPDAEQLNINSSNALLKILEEPPLNCLFVLQVANINRVLPTILSRSFKYRLQTPSKAEALNYIAKLDDPNAKFWLDYFAGEPLFDIPLNNSQLQLLIEGLLKPSIENIFMLSRELDPKKIGFAMWLEFLVKWSSDLMTVKLGGQACYFSDITDKLALLATRANSEKLFCLHDELLFMTPWSEHPINYKLHLENFLFKYQQIYA